MKKKFGIIGIALVVAMVASLSFGGVALADDPPEEGVIEIDMHGDNYGFQVTTLAPKSQDVFTGTAHSTLDMHQQIVYLPDTYYPEDYFDGKYHHTSGINVDCDIDRYAYFTGDGRIDVGTRYNTSGFKPGEYEADSLLYAYVESSGSEGYLSQQLRFERHRGGVYETGSMCIPQRNIDAWADGDYELGFGAVDLTGVIDDEGGPIDPEWWFDFCAADSSSYGHLFVDEAVTYANYLSGTGYSHHPDSFSVDFGFDWEGNAGSNTNWHGEFTYYANPEGDNKHGYNLPGDINMSIDIISNFVDGSGEIW